jgi:hypothetical protein
MPTIAWEKGDIFVVEEEVFEKYGVCLDEKEAIVFVNYGMRGGLEATREPIPKDAIPKKEGTHEQNIAQVVINLL